MKLYLTLGDGDLKIERVILEPASKDINQIVDDMFDSLKKAKEPIPKYD